MKKTLMHKKNQLLLLGCLLLFISQANAHEMWIEPVQYAIQPGEIIYAHEKVGQNFKGNQYSYLASSYDSFVITQNNQTRPIKSRIGDIPAVHEKMDESGLAVLTAATTVSDITYESWEKFTGFIKSKGLDWVLDKHQERGLPEKGFTEAYRRYAKSLVKVGDGKGKDQRMGLPLEWVVETNPYTTDKAFIRAQLLWQGNPFKQAYVGVFNRVANEPELQKLSLTTDDEGKVKIPVGKGGQFLINAVRMIEPKQEVIKETGAVWESLWASVTYEIP